MPAVSSMLIPTRLFPSSPLPTPDFEKAITFVLEGVEKLILIEETGLQKTVTPGK
jgi:hypothetical protein